MTVADRQNIFCYQIMIAFKYETEKFSVTQFEGDVKANKIRSFARKKDASPLSVVHYSPSNTNVLLSLKMSVSTRQPLVEGSMADLSSVKCFSYIFPGGAEYHSTAKRGDSLKGRHEHSSSRD